MTIMTDHGRRGAAETAHDAERDGGAPSDLFGEIRARFGDLRAEALEYLAIRLARLKLSLWERVLGLVALALAVLALGAFVVTAVVFCFSGIAGWIGEATGHAWLGPLLAGVAGLLAVGMAFLVLRSVLRRRAACKKEPCCDD
jgi:hypothetical protein